jgi:hypothetical protein
MDHRGSAVQQASQAIVVVQLADDRLYARREFFLRGAWTHEGPHPVIRAQQFATQFSADKAGGASHRDEVTGLHRQRHGLPGRPKELRRDCRCRLSERGTVKTLLASGQHL